MLHKWMRRRADLYLARSPRRMGAGVALIFDCILACAILAVGLALSTILINPVQQPSHNQALGEYATEILSFLDENGMLQDLAQKKDLQSLGNIIEGVLPSGVGFCICAYSPDWVLVWSFCSPGFGWRDAFASQPYLVSINGSPLIISLVLSE